VDPRWLRLAEIVEELRGASAVLASLVELAPLVDLSAAGVVLAVDPTGFAAQRLADPESRATILAAVRRVLGDGASLEIGALAPDASGSFTLARMVDAATRERRVELERRVREHPLVLAAVRAFDAEVRDLRLAADAESVSITATAAAIGRAQRESR
jgi:hypothetical protein